MPDRSAAGSGAGAAGADGGTVGGLGGEWRRCSGGGRGGGGRRSRLPVGGLELSPRNFADPGHALLLLAGLWALERAIAV